MNPTLFEQASRNVTALYGNMIAAYTVNTQIHLLLQEEEAFAKQSGGAPGYYEAASIGLRWAEITATTVAEA